MSEQETRATKEIVITVRGAAGTGKTTLMDIVAGNLSMVGLDVTVEYGPDGNPNRSQEELQFIADQLRDAIHVTVNEQSTRYPAVVARHRGDVDNRANKIYVETYHSCDGRSLDGFFVDRPTDPLNHFLLEKFVLSISPGVRSWTVYDDDGKFIHTITNPPEITYTPESNSHVEPVSKP